MQAFAAGPPEHAAQGNDFDTWSSDVPIPVQKAPAGCWVRPPVYWVMENIEQETQLGRLDYKNRC